MACSAGAACCLVSTWQDMDVLESINKALSPMKDFTDIMSGEKYVTFSATKPQLWHLESQVLLTRVEDTQLTNGIRKRVREYMKEKIVIHR